MGPKGPSRDCPKLKTWELDLETKLFLMGPKSPTRDCLVLKMSLMGLTQSLMGHSNSRKVSEVVPLKQKWKIGQLLLGPQNNSGQGPLLFLAESGWLHAFCQLK